jgi:hypothetical protein
MRFGVLVRVRRLRGSASVLWFESCAAHALRSMMVKAAHVDLYYTVRINSHILHAVPR